MIGYCGWIGWIRLGRLSVTVKLADLHDGIYRLREAGIAVWVFGPVTLEWQY